MKRTLILLGALLLSSLLFVGCGKKETAEVFDLSKYMEVRWKGENGKGEAWINFSRLQFQQDMIAMLSKKEGSNMQDVVLRVGLLEQSLTYTLDKRYGLSNGDTIIMTIQCNDEYVELFGIKVLTGSKKITVTGLGE